MTYSGSEDLASEAVAAPQTNSGYVTTFGWTDRYGRDRQLNIFADSADFPRVSVYERDPSAGEVPVVTVSHDGRFVWSPGQPAAAGVDTAAACNDLAETCRTVHTHGTGRLGYRGYGDGPPLE